MEKLFIGSVLVVTSVNALAVCPEIRAEQSAKQAAMAFAEMREMSGGLFSRVYKKSLVSAKDEVEYSAYVSAGSLGGEAYSVLVDKNCKPSSIQISDGLE